MTTFSRLRCWRSRRRFALPIALALALAPAGALAGNKEDARARVAKATRAHKDGRYDEARIELEAAYRLDPRPDLLYALGQIHAKLGNCREATAYFKRFVATQRDPQVGKVVDQAIAACQPPPPPRPPAASTSVASSDEPAAATDDPPANRPVPRATRSQPFGRTRTAPPAIAPASLPWYRDKLGDGLLLGGIAAGVVGLIEYRAALSDLDAAEDRARTPTLAGYRELLDRASSKRTTSIVLFAAGGALITGGIVRFVLHDRASEAPDLAVVPAPGGGVLTYGGTF